MNERKINLVYDIREMKVRRIRDKCGLSRSRCETVPRDEVQLSRSFSAFPEARTHMDGAATY